MKKLLTVASIILSLLFIIPTNSLAQNNEKILTDTFLTTLYPYINNAVTGYYGQLKQFSPADAKVISITRKNEGGYDFDVVVTIMPFEKAHIYLGTDTVTMNVSAAGVTVINYSHKKSKYE